jgi:hypothetical protein
MGDIVEFQSLKSKSRRSDEPVPVAGAEILFFIGIRYERTDVSVAPKPSRKRSRGTAPAKVTPSGGLPAVKGKPPRRLA